MSRWQDSIVKLQRDKTPAILVSVDSIVGSTPREPGAKMIVTRDHLYGTIGGGNLEFQACRIARDQLVSGSVVGNKRFPLGAGLGQCCGGLVNLVFERLDDADSWNRAEGEVESLELYLKDLEISKKLDNSYLIANCLGNIGNIYCLFILLL